MIKEAFYNFPCVCCFLIEILGESWANADLISKLQGNPIYSRSSNSHRLTHFKVPFFISYSFFLFPLSFPISLALEFPLNLSKVIFSSRFGLGCIYTYDRQRVLSDLNSDSRETEERWLNCSQFWFLGRSPVLQNSCWNLIAIVTVSRKGPLWSD